MMKKLLIRVDMNQKIATGHMMRCLSIADAANEKNIKVFFVSADENGRALVEARGYKYISLRTQWDKMEEELSEIEKVICELRPDYILVDSYYITTEYMKKLQELTKVAYIDDLCDKVYQCDTLICYANYYKKYNLQERYPENTQLLLGCDYVPLRKCFSNVEQRDLNESVKEILLLSGGTDPYHFLKTFLKLRDERKDIWKEIKISVICGVYNADYKEIVESYVEDELVEILTNVSDVEKYMNKADIAVSAAGTSLYELCACGTPTVCYTFADNQLDNAKIFSEDDIMVYAGDLRNCNVVENIIDKVEALNLDHEKRIEMSKKMVSLVNGQGASRIVSRLNM